METTLTIKKSSFKVSTVSFSMILSIIVLFLFMGDAYSKYLLYKSGVFGNVSLILRALFEVFMLAVIIRKSAKNTSRNYLSYIFLLILLAALYLVSQTVLLHNQIFKYNLIFNLIMFNKFIFIFIIYIFLRSVNFSIDKVIKIVFIIFYFNAFCILSGALFDIDLFKTAVGKEYRFGYSGLIASAGNEATYIVIFSIILFYFRTFFVEKKLSYSFFFIILTSLLVGQKTIYLFLIVLFTYHVIHFFSIKKIPIYIALVIGILYALLIFINSEYFNTYFSYFIYAVDKFDFLTMILGGRNHIIAQEFPEVVSHWNVINLLFGGRDSSIYYMESEFLDLFLSFGILGTLIYLFIFYIFYLYNAKDSFLRFMVLSTLLIAVFSGHFLTSAIAVLYFNLIYLFIYEKVRKL